MNIEVLFVQFLILAFTAVLWWIARRDLASRSAPSASPPPADTADLEQLCATLETLVTRLSRRLDLVERQIAQGSSPAVAAAATLPEPVRTSEPVRIPEPVRTAEPARVEEELARIAEGLARMEEGLAQRQGERQAEPAPMPSYAQLQPVPDTVPYPAPNTVPEPKRDPEPSADPRYASVYAMLDEGVTDPVEIARRTGLGRGEVELIISLRERRAF